MPRSLPPLLLTCAFALLVSGCDRQTTPPAQPRESAAAAAEQQLTGKLDRSHAGAAMPVAVLKDKDGKFIKLDDLKGKPALVNLWATWCAPCIVEMPKLDAMAGEMKDKLPVVTISEDLTGAEAVAPFFAQHGYKNLPQWLDTKNELPVLFNVTDLPLTVLYGKDGKEVWRVTGGYDWSSTAARAQVAEAFKAS